MSFGVQVSIATISSCRPARIFLQNRHENRRNVTVFWVGCMRWGLNAGLIQKVGQSGQNYRDFRDLFSCTILTKDFPEKRYFVSNCPVLSITDSKLSRQSPVENISCKVRPGNFRSPVPPVPAKARGLAVCRWWNPVWLDSGYRGL